MEIVNTEKPLYCVYGQRHSNGDVFGWQEFDDLPSAKECYEYYCCEYSYALSNININLMEFRGKQRIMHAVYPIFEVKERPNTKEEDIIATEKCYVIYFFTEGYEIETNIEGIFVDLDKAKKFYDKKCEEYRPKSKRLDTCTAYLAEYMGGKKKILQEKDIYVEDEEDD